MDNKLCFSRFIWWWLVALVTMIGATEWFWIGVKFNQEVNGDAAEGLSWC